MTALRQKAFEMLKSFPDEKFSACRQSPLLQGSVRTCVHRKKVV